MTVLDTIDPEILANTIATVATIGPKGDPQMTAVWYLVDGDHIIVSAVARRQKTKNIAANPNISMLIFLPGSVDYYVEIRGTATLVDDADYAIADRIAVRYGADFRNFDGPDDHRLIIDFAPTRALVTDVR
ncbi:MAG: class probable F420-dependent enzyme [Ilumatobacteraceae bacterium]|nr:class probable F420-dependent enzyme [Ilumatobacteraceae bacterium]